MFYELVQRRVCFAMESLVNKNYLAVVREDALQPIQGGPKKPDLFER